MEDFSKSLLLRDYDAVFVFNRENGQYHTLVLSKKLFNVVPSEGTYEEGMEVLAKYVLPEEREFFRRHTERDRILKLVDSVEKAGATTGFVCAGTSNFCRVTKSIFLRRCGMKPMR